MVDRGSHADGHARRRPARGDPGRVAAVAAGHGPGPARPPPSRRSSRCPASRRRTTRPVASIVGVHPGDSVVTAPRPRSRPPAPRRGLSGVLGGLVGGVAGCRSRSPPATCPACTTRYTLGKVDALRRHDALRLQLAGQGHATPSRYVVAERCRPARRRCSAAITGCKQTTVTPTQDQLGTLTKDNVKVTDNAVYSGKIVVAKDPPEGHDRHPGALAVGQRQGRPDAHVGEPAGGDGRRPEPGARHHPALPKPPGLGGSGGGGNGGSGKGGSHGSGGVKYTPPALTVPEQVMPHAVNYGGGGIAAPSYRLPQRSVGGHIVAPRAPKPPRRPLAGRAPVRGGQRQAGKKTVDLGDGSAAGQAAAGRCWRSWRSWRCRS